MILPSHLSNLTGNFGFHTENRPFAAICLRSLHTLHPNSPLMLSCRQTFDHPSPLEYKKLRPSTGPQSRFRHVSKVHPHNAPFARAPYAPVAGPVSAFIPGPRISRRLLCLTTCRLDL